MKYTTLVGPPKKAKNNNNKAFDKMKKNIFQNFTFSRLYRFSCCIKLDFLNSTRVIHIEATYQ
uniref:Uncharacterized protein n=1 Tax=Romanomermis culicivorax TaxID=13658 RepID=A0A915KGN1_ROMCU